MTPMKALIVRRTRTRLNENHLLRSSVSNRFRWGSRESLTDIMEEANGQSIDL